MIIVLFEIKLKRKQIKMNLRDISRRELFDTDIFDSYWSEKKNNPLQIKWMNTIYSEERCINRAMNYEFTLQLKANQKTVFILFS